MNSTEYGETATEEATTEIYKVVTPPTPPAEVPNKETKVLVERLKELKSLGINPNLWHSHLSVEELEALKVKGCNEHTHELMWEALRSSYCSKKCPFGEYTEKRETHEYNDWNGSPYRDDIFKTFLSVFERCGRYGQEPKFADLTSPKKGSINIKDAKPII
jgi:hypothetical protein